jgi:hypothetical protein
VFANQFIRPAAEFGVGPDAAQGLGLFREIWSRIQGARTHPYGPEKSDPSITFNGYAASPQAFEGFNAQGGAIPYRNGGNATLATGLVEGPLGDPARRIFAARLKRQTSVGGLG